MYKNDKYAQMFENLNNIISQNNQLYKQIQLIKNEHNSSLKSFKHSIKKINEEIPHQDQEEQNIFQNPYYRNNRLPALYKGNSVGGGGKKDNSSSASTSSTVEHLSRPLIPN
jgi:seryl-tRNA synthetase